ncbi:MAG: hypothetical protein IAX21_00180 [Candidatus Bathyarchaeota archaeon]|nr:MAG: hypothetical protein IAX21_00180 [Candidatus Bathyarchaeota archaeon]
MGNHLCNSSAFTVCKGLIAFFIIVLLSFSFVVSGYCLSETAFTSDDVFEIPQTNSSVRFTTNGTYENAVLEKNTWFFDGLYFSSFFTTQKLNVTISASDCHLTINPFRFFRRTSQGENVTWVLFSYRVQGQGKQVINLGLDPQKGHIDAILDGEFIGLNHGWVRSPDGTITVTAPVSNVTLWYYGHPESYLQEPNFFEDHSVVIGSTFSMAVIVGLATFITRKKGNKEA